MHRLPNILLMKKWDARTHQVQAKWDISDDATRFRGGRQPRIRNRKLAVKANALL